MSTRSDHAFPMHLHLHPQNCTTQSVLILAGSQCVPQLGWDGSCCAFLQTQTFKSISVELKHSMEHGGNTGLCFDSGKNPVTDYCLCEPPGPPKGLGWHKEYFDIPV